MFKGNNLLQRNLKVDAKIKLYPVPFGVFKPAINAQDLSLSNVQIKFTQIFNNETQIGHPKSFCETLSTF